MQNSSAEMKEQIEAVNQLTGLSRFVIEKDLYVTQAISIVTLISNDYYDLIFQGGTSLAKAYRIIERMSEDCDFRIHFKNAENNLSKEAKRKILRKFRYELIDALKLNGFGINNSDISVRNEGQFMAVRANYPSIYPVEETLKPFLALEFFQAEVKAIPEQKTVTTLIKQILDDKVTHQEFPVSSVAIVETAAEKWVGLTKSKVYQAAIFAGNIILLT